MAKAFNNNVLFSGALFTACLMVALVSGFQFEVGEKRGWIKPTGKEPETYNEWAAQNRFRIGDSVHFKYRNDSVMEVNAADYLQCDASNAISKFSDGSTVFLFDRSGFFYFISGNPDHCELGQKLIVRVMHPSEVESPELAPSPAGGGDGGWDWGATSSVNGTTKLYFVSYFMTAFAGLFLVFYIFV